MVDNLHDYPPPKKIKKIMIIKVHNFALITINFNVHKYHFSMALILAAPNVSNGSNFLHSYWAKFPQERKLLFVSEVKGLNRSFH